MSAQTLAAPSVAASAATRVMTPGVYRGGSQADFGIWRLRPDGVWLFCVPVAGAVWRIASDQDAGYALTELVDEALVSSAAAASAATGEMKPGIYRGKSAAEFGLWRLNAYGVWLYCAPVLGAVWKRSADQNLGDTLIMLVDETRI